MNDIEIINKLKILINYNFYFKIKNEKCIELNLTDKNYIYFGIIRHYSKEEKKVILSLISKLSNLEKLDLRRNKLEFMEENFFENFVHLEYLDLGSNYLKQLPKSIKYLKKLKFLNLAVNCLEICPNFFNNFEHLEILLLHKNKFSYLDESISSLKNLKSLNIYGLNLKHTPLFIFDLKELFNLTISHFSIIPREIENLQKLEFFTNNIAIKLKELPDEFTTLKNLKMTRLYQNSITHLPNDFGNLSKLEQLSLYQNKLTELPKSFSNLQNLKKLNLGWNSFNEFPKEILFLKNLEWLGYFNNKTTIPDLDFIKNITTNHPHTEGKK